MNFTDSRYNPNYNNTASQIIGAIRGLTENIKQSDIRQDKILTDLKRKKEQEEREAKKKRLNLQRIDANNLSYNYNLEVQNLLGNEKLEGQNKLKAIKELGVKYAGLYASRQKEAKDSEAYLKGYQHVNLKNITLFNQVKEVEEQKIKKKLRLDFGVKLQAGAFASLDSANKYAKTIGVEDIYTPEKIKQAYEQLGTSRIMSYIQSSVVDGVPNELLQFKDRDDIAKKFYPEIGKNANIPNGVINAIASAHRWDIGEKRRVANERERKRIRLANQRAKEEERRLAITSHNLQRQIQIDIANGNRPSDATIRGLQTVGAVQGGMKGTTSNEWANKGRDVQKITDFVTQSANSGKSKIEIEQALNTFTTSTPIDKFSVMGRITKKIIDSTSLAIDSILHKDIPYEQKKQLLGNAYEKLYNFDPLEAYRKGQRDISKELTTLTTSNFDSLMIKLDTSIALKQQHGEPIDLSDKTLLNELESAKLMINNGRDKKEVSTFLNAKKREYIESKRSKGKKDLAIRTQEINNYLSSKWTAFDETANKRDIQRFLLQNPDIPINRLGEMFDRETVKIDTTSSTLRAIAGKSWGGKYDIELSNSLQNGRILIPRDKHNLSAPLRDYIGTHADEFVSFAVEQIKPNIKELEKEFDGHIGKIEELNLTFDLNMNGELVGYIYATPQATGTEELLGIMDTKEITTFLNKVK